MTGSLSADLLRVLHDAEKESPLCLRRPPQAAFVLKFRDVSYRKLFVNVCRLEEYGRVVHALQLEPEDERFALPVASLSTPFLLSKTATPSTDKRNQPCTVIQCGCDGGLLDRIQADGAAVHEQALTVRLAEALEGRGWMLAPGLGSVVRPKMKTNRKGDIPEVLRWGFPVKEAKEVPAQAQETTCPQPPLGHQAKTGDIKIGLRAVDSAEDATEPLMVATKTVRYTLGSSAGNGALPRADRPTPKQVATLDGLRRGFLL